MVCILCHLGDAPMHAEISNTTNPSNCLNPCRMCELTVQTMDDKQTKEYIREFVGLSQNYCNVSSTEYLSHWVGPDGWLFFQVGLRQRDWNKTKDHTHRLWDLCKHPDNIARFDTQSSLFGIRDHLNLQFVKEVQELHRDHHKNPPLEILKYCKALEVKHGPHMFNPFLRLKGNFVCLCSLSD